MVVGPIAVVFMLVLLVAAYVRRRRGHGGRHRVRRGPGAGAAGAVYELLNEDRRRALEIIVEQRAEATDPETADGNLPDLEHPRK